MFKSRTEIIDQVYELVSQIPKGKVATYGDIAKIVVVSPRYIGFVLHNNPYPGKVPCHRIVNAAGRVAANFAFGGGDSQQQMLEDEGIIFEKSKLDLGKYRYTF